MIWDALGRAGWLGQTAELHPLIGLVIEVVPVPEGAILRRPRFVPRPGGWRRECEGGWLADDGRICQGYEGPLHARAAGPGVRLVESEWRVEEFDGFEDMLYTAAVRAGWVPVVNTRAVGEVPEVDICVRVPRHEL